MKKVLFINPAIAECGIPNLGLAMLSAVLKQSGHDVKVADYHFSFKTPNIYDILNDFKPDVVGISMYSAMKNKINEMIEIVNNANIPILCGGPHTISYYSELLTDSRLDYIFLGEAEDAISHVVKDAKVNEKPELIYCPVPDINSLPFPDYSSFYCYDSIKVYPFITSRGCPYNCSFCSIHLSNSKKWRHRKVESSITELSLAHKNYPSIEKLMIWDDNFSLDIKQAKLFLKKYIDKKFNFKLEVVNIRADRLDKNFLILLEKAGCEEIQFGVEHGNPAVFREIDKGETLDDIRRSAKLVKEHGMRLGCSFIIGLPQDTFKKTFDSIRIAKELKPDHIHWNILVPYKGTRVYEYFKKHGQVNDNFIPFTIPQDVLSFEPNADTPYFTREERKKAYLMALLLSSDTLLLHDIRKTFHSALKYNLKKEFLKWLINPKIIKRWLWITGKRILKYKQ